MVRRLAHHHAPSLLQVIAVSGYRKQQPVGYFSLPAEIRNMIMELVLVPGEVLLNASNAIEPDHKPTLLQGTLHRMMKRVFKRSDENQKLHLFINFRGINYWPLANRPVLKVTPSSTHRTIFSSYKVHSKIHATAWKVYSLSTVR